MPTKPVAWMVTKDDVGQLATTLKLYADEFAADPILRGSVKVVPLYPASAIADALTEAADAVAAQAETFEGGAKGADGMGQVRRANRLRACAEQLRYVEQDLRKRAEAQRSKA